MWVKVSGAWREVDRVLCNVNGIWKDGDYHNYCAYIRSRYIMKKVSLLQTTVWEYTYSTSYKSTYQAAVNPEGDLFALSGYGDWGARIDRFSRDGELICYMYSNEGNNSGAMSCTPDGNILTSGSYWWGQSGKRIYKRDKNFVVIWSYPVNGALGVEKMTVDSAGYIYFCFDQIQEGEDNYVEYRTRLTPTGAVSWRQHEGYDYGGDVVLGSYVYDHTPVPHGGGGWVYPGFSKINKTTGDIVFTKYNYDMYPWGRIKGTEKMETDGQYLYVATRGMSESSPTDEEVKAHVAKVDLNGNVIDYMAFSNSYNPSLSVCPKGIYVENYNTTYFLDFDLNIIWQTSGNICAADPGLYPVFSNRWN